MIRETDEAVETVRWKRVLATALLGTAVVLGVAAFLLNVTPPSVEEDRLQFELVSLDGRAVSPNVAPYAGKVLLVDIWGLWCPPCIQQIPYLVDLQRRFEHHGFEVIGVEFAAYYGDDREEYTQALREWAEAKKINYTLVQGGETSDVEALFPTLRNFAGFPTSVLIDRQGRVRLVTQGFAPSEMARFEDLVKRLLIEEPDATISPADSP